MATKTKIKTTAVSPSLFWDLFDSSKPWILVDNGSLDGHFDFVPLHLRTGPWMSFAPYLLCSLVLSVILGLYYGSSSKMNEESDDTTHYPEYLSLWWCYNLVVFVWITIISNLVLRGPLGIGAWSTYSMWTWTILHFRHLLMVLSPWNNTTVRLLLELSRFPMLMMCTLTFVVWNFILAPLIYFYFKDNPQKQKKFVSHFTSFRLIQIHVFNLPFAYMNGVCSSSTPYLLTFKYDFMSCWIISVLYICWYTLVLDRIGVHLYPIFSLRSKYMILIWLLLILGHYALFCLWQVILKIYE